MNDFLEGILERPTSHKIGIWLFILIFLVYVFWQYFYKGPFEEVTKLEERRETLQAQIVNERRIARNLNKVREQVKELDAKLNQALLELPNEAEIPDLIDSISDLARQAGLDIRLFKRRGTNYRDFYAEVLVAMSLSGTYHQVATFFDEVGQMARIVNINDVTVRDPSISEQGVEVNADCTATTFFYVDESGRVGEAGNDDGAARRRRR